MINMEDIAYSVGAPDEHPLARRVWHVLRMREWRNEWRAAQSANDCRAMDRLDRQFDFLQAI